MNHARIYEIGRRMSGYGLGIGLVFVAIGAGLAIVGHRTPGAMVCVGGIVVSMQWGFLYVWAKRNALNPGSQARACDDLIDRR